MPSLLFAPLTALLMMVHSVIGCCWHHAHARHDHSGCEPAISGATCDAGHADYHPAAEESTLPAVVEGALGHRLCAESSCAYLKPPRATINSLAADGGATSGGLPCGRLAASPVGCLLEPSPRSADAPPLRAGLSVWLL